MVRYGVMTLVLLTLVCAACAPVRPKFGTPVNAEVARRLIQGWQENAARIRSVQGLSNYHLEAPMTKLQGTQVILVEKPDRLRAETLNPFGFPLLTLTASRGRVGVYLVAQNLYYTGAASADNLGEFIHIPLPPEDLVGILLYSPSLIDAWKVEAFTLQEGGWIVLRHGALLRQEFIFNPEQQLVEVAFFENNDLQFKVEYAQFTEQEPFYPTLLNLELPEKHATIDLEFSGPEINHPMRSGVFEVAPPAGAKVVYLPN